MFGSVRRHIVRGSASVFAAFESARMSTVGRGSVARCYARSPEIAAAGGWFMTGHR
jgi:hypothetical protein